MHSKRKIIVITDGDNAAKRSVEQVAYKVGGRCISSSAGNPTPIDGQQLVEMILQTPYDPIFVMIDDNGKIGRGKGEKILEYLLNHPQIEILGVVAVASNSYYAEKIKVDYSVDRNAQLIAGSVNKNGYAVEGGLRGDTVEILNEKKVPIIIGTGDTGKMEGRDSIHKGNPVTLKAVKEILARSGFNVGKS